MRCERGTFSQAPNCISLRQYVCKRIPEAMEHIVTFEYVFLDAGPPPGHVKGSSNTPHDHREDPGDDKIQCEFRTDR